MKFDIILACDSKKWIWKSWDLAWRLKKDLKYFKEITTKVNDINKINAIIMGKNTWKSIPENFRPLPWRLNCILSRNIEDLEIIKNENVIFFSSFESCLKDLWKRGDIENIFVIWWANLYNQVLNHNSLDKIYITELEWDFACDVFFNWIPKDFYNISESEEFEENDIKFKFKIYQK